MPQARVTWIGWSEFEDALRGLPNHLTIEAQGIVRAAAEATAEEVRAAYPVRQTNLTNARLGPPGGMRRGVRVDPGKTSRTGGYVVYVRATAPHTHFWERGTNVRETATTHANRGAVHEHLQQGLVATADRHGPPMQEQLAALVRSEGFEVQGGYELV